MVLDTLGGGGGATKLNAHLFTYFTFGTIFLPGGLQKQLSPLTFVRDSLYTRNSSLRIPDFTQNLAI